MSEQAERLEVVSDQLAEARAEVARLEAVLRGAEAAILDLHREREGTRGEAAQFRAALDEAEAWGIEVKRQWCILLERNQVLGEALAVYADEGNWLKQWDEYGQVWTGVEWQGEPYKEAWIPAQEALSAGAGIPEAAPGELSGLLVRSDSGEGP